MTGKPPEDYAGGLAVLVDAAWADGRGRGILFAPAQDIATADVVTMVVEGRGICAVTINEATAMRLGLHPQGTPRSGEEPYFANSVEAVACTETGISARERATTLRAVGNPDAVVSDLTTPGHIMVQVARNVLRDGASLPEIANALLSAHAITRFTAWTDILDADGDLASAGDCAELAARLGLDRLEADAALAFARARLPAWDAAVRFSRERFG